LFAAVLASTSFAAKATLYSGQTFIAHRNELANAGMEWATGNAEVCKKENCHTAECTAQSQKRAENCDRTGRQPNKDKKRCNKLGACFTATPFFEQSTNNTDLAYLFGMGTTGKITVTQGIPVVATTGAANTTAMSTTLYNTNVQLSPNSDGTSSSASAGDADTGSYVDTAKARIPMSGVVNLSPIRQAYGAHLGWSQSLDALLEGLSFTVRAPIVQVRTSMRSTLTSSVASNIPSEDGPSGGTLKEYFNGSLSIARTGSNLHVIQYPMTKGLIDNTYATATGLADIEFAMNYAFKFKKTNAVHAGVGASVLIPTSKKPTMTRLFEPLYGARGHVAAGAQGFIHADLYKNENVRVGLDLTLNWKYFFKGAELRTMGVYDTVLRTMLPASQYRLVMQHGVTGVQPAANVLTVNQDVTPRNQVDAVVGFSATCKNLAFNVGYNLYWHQTDRVSAKAGAWTNDKYAYAHPHYSMNTAIPASVAGVTDDETFIYYVVGGTSFVDHTAAAVNHNGGFLGDATGTHLSPAYDGTFADTRASTVKHSYAIGSNGDAGNTIRITATGDDDFVSDTSPTTNVPAAFTSAGGPIQAAGIAGSALPKLVATVATGVNANDTGTLAVRYNTSSLPGVTYSQLTHSVVGGLSYKFDGNFPITIGAGAQGEFQATSRNSAIEGYKVWAKLGVAF